MPLSPDRVLAALATVADPETGLDIVRLDRVKNLQVTPEAVSFTLVLPRPSRAVEEAARAAVAAEAGPTVALRIDTDSPMISLGDDLVVSEAGRRPAPVAPPGVRNFIAVASGKGGVGKSTVAVNLALALARQGFDVGLVDTDIYGPSIPTMLGLRAARPTVDERRKILPIEAHGLKLLSMGFLMDPEQATIWRGPMVSSAVRQFLSDAAWGTLDFLVLDLPPGTGDIQLTIVQTVPLTGAVIVSTPQEVALADARRGIAMFRNVNVPVLGIVENMAFFAPPDLPDRKYYLFGRGGAHRLAGELAVPFLGEIPLEQAVREGGDEGRPTVAAAPDSPAGRAFLAAADVLMRQVRRRNAEQPPTQPVEILHR